MGRDGAAGDGVLALPRLGGAWRMGRDGAADGVLALLQRGMKGGDVAQAGSEGGSAFQHEMTMGAERTSIPMEVDLCTQNEEDGGWVGDSTFQPGMIVEEE
eukprot:639902-Amphidinium_carterae.1